MPSCCCCCCHPQAVAAASAPAAPSPLLPVVAAAGPIRRKICSLTERRVPASSSPSHQMVSLSWTTSPLPKRRRVSQTSSWVPRATAHDQPGSGAGCVSAPLALLRSGAMPEATNSSALEVKLLLLLLLLLLQEKLKLVQLALAMLLQLLQPLVLLLLPQVSRHASCCHRGLSWGTVDSTSPKSAHCHTLDTATRFWGEICQLRPCPILRSGARRTRGSLPLPSSQKQDAEKSGSETTAPKAEKTCRA